MRILNPWALSGGVTRAQVPAINVPLTTGIVGTVSNYGLLTPVVFAKTGGSSNLTINSSTGAISAAVALTAGQQQTLTGTVTGADGVVIPFTVTLTGAVSVPAAPTLGTPVPGNGTLTIPWTDGANGGSAITARYYSLGTAPGGEGALQAATLTGGNLVLTGVTNGHVYYVEGYTFNGVGSGYSPASNEVNGTPASVSPTIVSASNRTRFNASLATSTGKSTDLWNNVRTLHYTANAASGLQASYFTGYLGGANLTETASTSYEILRHTWLTNLVGTANIVEGGSGPPQNQAGCTTVAGTWSQLRNAQGLASDVSLIRDINYNLVSYAAWVAAGGVISTTVITDDTCQNPPGYSVDTDPGPSLSAGSYYFAQTEQHVPLGVTGAGNWANVVRTVVNPVQSLDGTRTNSCGDYYAQKGAQNGMVNDPNWSTYSASPGALVGTTPWKITGTSATGAKTIVIDGASVDNGTYEYGDFRGTSGVIQRAAIAAGYGVINMAIPSSSFNTSRVGGGYAYRIGACQYATGGVTSGAALNDNPAGMGTAGTFYAALSNGTNAVSNLMAGTRWWNNLLRTKMPAGSKLANFTFSVGTATGIVDTVAVTAISATATAIGSTVTVTAPNHNLSVGTGFAIAGVTTSGYNNSGSGGHQPVASVIDANNFTYINTVVLGATTATLGSTPTITDGYQSLANQQQPTDAALLPGGVIYLYNDYTMRRNSYAQPSQYSAANGDADFYFDMRHAIGASEGSSSPANIFPPGNKFRNASADGTHIGYFLAAAATSVLAPQLQAGFG